MVQDLISEELFSRTGRNVISRSEVQMQIWRDVWPELSVLLVLIGMAGVLAVTYVLGR